MTHFEITSLFLSIIGIILIPVLGFLIRGAVKWTRTEDRLATLVDDVRELVNSSERVHTAMYDQMRADRDATNKRLRFIEEWFMNARNRR
jgi:hypothetical protein